MVNIINDYGLYIIIAESVIIIALLLWFNFISGTSSKIAYLKNRINSLESKLWSRKDELNTYKAELDKANIELKNWSDWYRKNKHLLSKQDGKSTVTESKGLDDSKEQLKHDQVLFHYLQEANNRRFLRLLPTPDKCFFRTWEENGVRKYEFYGNVDKALANMNAIFDDVCDIEGKRGGATAIENVSPGTLDSDLRIIHKAKIRFK